MANENPLRASSNSSALATPPAAACFQRTGRFGSSVYSTENNAPSSANATRRPTTYVSGSITCSACSPQLLSTSTPLERASEMYALTATQSTVSTVVASVRTTSNSFPHTIPCPCGTSNTCSNTERIDPNRRVENQMNATAPNTPTVPLVRTTSCITGSMSEPVPPSVAGKRFWMNSTAAACDASSDVLSAKPSPDASSRTKGTPAARMPNATPPARKKRSSLPALSHNARAYAPATASGLPVRPPRAIGSTPGIPAVAKTRCLLLQNDQELRAGPELVRVGDVQSAADPPVLVRRGLERGDVLAADHAVVLVRLRKGDLAHLRLVDRGEVRRVEVARRHLRLSDAERPPRLVDDLLLEQLVLRPDHVVDRVALRRQRRLLLGQLGLLGGELRLVLLERGVLGLERGELRVERHELGLLVLDYRLERGDGRIVGHELRGQRGVVCGEILHAVAARAKPCLGVVEPGRQLLDLDLDRVALLRRSLAGLRGRRRALHWLAGVQALDRRELRVDARYELRGLHDVLQQRVLFSRDLLHLGERLVEFGLRLVTRADDEHGKQYGQLSHGVVLLSGFTRRHPGHPARRSCHLRSRRALDDASAPP